MKAFSDDSGSYSYNKVDEALQSVGVQMKKSNGDFKGFYDVIDELSQKWDSLSQKQKVYVATQAAGSRQQSRFIAMVDNQTRSQQLLSAAYDADGAAEEQYEKTLDSLQAKLNQLKDAWDNFTMSIAQSSTVKVAVDGLTGLLKIINKLLGVSKQIGTAFGGKFGGGLAQSLTAITTALAGFKLAGGGALGFLKSIQDVIKFGKGELGTTKGLGDILLKNFKAQLGGGLLGGATIKNLGKLIGRDFIPAIFKEGSSVMNKHILQLGKDATNILSKYYNEEGIFDSKAANDALGSKNVKALQEQAARAEELSVSFGKVGEAGKAGSFGIKAFWASLTPLGQALLVVTAALTAFTAAYRLYNAHLKSNVKAGNEAVKTYTNSQKTYKENTKTINSANEAISQYSYGVDEQGRNISLTVDQYRKYTDAVKSLTKAYPSLIKGTNSSGQAFIDNSSAIGVARQKALQTYNKQQKAFTKQSTGQVVLMGAQDKLKLSESYKKGKSLIDEASTSTYETDLSPLTKYGAVSKDILNTKKQAYALDKLDVAQAKIQLQTSKASASEQTKGLKGLKQLESAQKAQNKAVKSYNKWVTNYADQNNMFGALDDRLQGAARQNLRTISVGAVSSGQSNKTTVSALGKYKKALQQDGSQITKILDNVQKAQDKFNNSGKTNKAYSEYKTQVESAKDSLEDLKKGYEEMANSSDQATSEAGKAMADMVQQQIDSMNVAVNAAKGYAGDLASAMNPWLDKLTAADEAYKTFQDATQKDYYTGAENMSNILKDTLDSKNTAGWGSQTFWKGAETVLGTKQLKKLGYNIDKVKSHLEGIQSATQSGEKGFVSFASKIVGARKEIEKFGGKVGTDKNGNLSSFYGPTDKFDKLASTLGVSNETLGAMLNNAHQFMKIDFNNVKAMKENLANSEQTIVTGSGKNKQYFVNESTLKQAFEQSGGLPQDYNNQRKNWASEGINAISTKTSAKQFINMFKQMGGMENAKNTSQYDFDKVVTTLYKAGFTDKSDLEKITDKLGAKLSSQGDTYGDLNSLINALAEGNEANDAEKTTASNTSSILSTLNSLALKEGIETSSQKQERAKLETQANSFSKDWTNGTFNPKTGEMSLTGGQFEKSKMYNNSHSQNKEMENQANSYKNQLKALKKSYSDNNANGQYDKQIAALDGKIKAVDEALGKYHDMIKSSINSLQAGDLKGTISKDAQQSIYQHTEGGQKASSGSEALTDAQNLKTLYTQGKITKDVFQQLSEELVDVNKTSLSHLSGEEFGSLLNQLDLSKKKTAELKQAFDKVHLKSDYKNLFSGKDKVTKHTLEIITDVKSSTSDKVNSVLELASQKTGKSKKVVLDIVAKAASGKESIGSLLKKYGITDKGQQKTIRQTVKLITSGKLGSAKDIQKILKRLTGKNYVVKVKSNTRSAEKNIDKVQHKADKVGKTTAKPKVSANVGSAIKDISNVISKLKNVGKQHPKPKISVIADGALSIIDSIRSGLANLHDKTIHVNTVKSGYENTGSTGKKYSSESKGTATHSQVHTGSLASGTGSGKIGPNGRGGLTLTGEKGYEIAWLPSDNSSMILGNGGPEMANLPADAVVYNHQQSRQIMKRGGLSIGSLVSGNVNWKKTSAPAWEKYDKLIAQYRDDPSKAEFVKAYDAQKKYFLAEQKKAKAQKIDYTKHKFGNVDMNNRQKIFWNNKSLKKNQKALQSLFPNKSWKQIYKENKGGYSDVLGASGEYDGVNISYSPMVQGKKKAALLNQNQINKYLFKQIRKVAKAAVKKHKKGWTSEDLLKADKKGTVMKISGKKMNVHGLISGIGSEKQMEKLGNAMHYSGKAGSIYGAYEDAMKALNGARGNKKNRRRKNSRRIGSAANGTAKKVHVTKIGSASIGTGSAARGNNGVNASHVRVSKGAWGNVASSKTNKTNRTNKANRSIAKSASKTAKHKKKEEKASKENTVWTLKRGKVSAKIYNIEKKIEYLKRKETTLQNKYSKFLEKNWITVNQAQAYLKKLNQSYQKQIALEKQIIKHYKGNLKKLGANTNPNTGKASKITGTAKIKGSKGKTKTYKLSKYGYVGEDGKLHYKASALKKVDKKARKQIKAILKKKYTKNQGIKQSITTTTKGSTTKKNDRIGKYAYVDKDGNLHYNTKALKKLTAASQKKVKQAVKKNFKNGKLKNASISTTSVGKRTKKKDNIYNYVTVDKNGHLSINDSKLAKLAKASRKAVRARLKKQLAYNKAGKKITVEYTKTGYKSGKKGKRTKTSKSAKAKINTRDYVNYDPETGLATINNIALGKLGKKNKSLANNLKSKLEDLIDKYNQGVQEAEDEVQEAKDAIEEARKQLAESFYLWENELTRLKDYQRQVTELGNISNIYSANKDYTSAMALNGNMEGGAAGTRIGSINNKLAQKLLDQVKAQRQIYTESYKQLLILTSRTPEASDVFAPLLKGIADGNEEAKTRKSDIIKAIQSGISVTQDENGNLRSTIDRNAIMNRILSQGLTSDTASLVSDVIGKCQDLIDTNQGAAADMYNAQSQLIQLQSDARADLSDQASTLITGLQNGRKEESDELSDINDAINNLQSRVLDKLQKQINLERQKRENEKTEKNIADLQNQLALLQQDTSGSNAASIKDLQNQLKEAQQDYADSLVDQQIQNMQDANEQAANQRETQISILNAQSDQLSQIDKDLIDSILQNPLTSVNKDQFINLYRKANDYDNLTKTQQAQVDAEANKAYASAVADRNTLSDDFASKITSGINYVTRHESGEDDNLAISGAADAEQQASDYEKNPSSLPGYVNNNPSDPFANKHKYFNSIKDIENYLNDNGFSFNGHQKVDSEREKEMEDILKSGDSLTLYRRPGKKVNAISTGAQAFFSRYGNDVIGWNYRDGQALTDGKNGKLLSKAWRKAAVKRHPKYKEIFDKLGVTYKNGGLANFTGPAWLDGTTSHPEMVLNARDTANFIQLKDVLSDVRRSAGAITPKNESTQNTFDININVDKIDSDYDVDQIAARVKRNIIREAGYRNVNIIGNFK